MPLAPAPNVFRWWYTTNTAPATTVGVSVTPGASNAEGSATVVATSGDLIEDTYLLWLCLLDGNTATAIKHHLVDIGVDPAGGTSYDWRVENLQMGASGSNSTGGRQVAIPLFIPAGSQVAIRVQGNNATAGTVRAWAMFFGRPTRPEMVWAGTYSENLGTITSSHGPAVTPGTSAAEGSWTNIGTTTFAWRWLHAGLNLDDASTNGQMIFMDVAINVGGTRQIVLEHWPIRLSGTSEIVLDPYQCGRPCFVDIPAGSDVDVRLSTTLATADTGYDVNLVGIG